MDVAVGVDPCVDLLRPPRREGEQDGDGDGDTLNDPNKIVYMHYSRYSNQAKERMDVEIWRMRALAVCTFSEQAWTGSEHAKGHEQLL